MAALDWHHGAWEAGAQARFVGEQFGDDLNSLELAPFVTVDAAVGYRFNEHVSALLRVENLFDTEVETGKTGNGLTSIGAPRLVSFTVAMEF